MTMIVAWRDPFCLVSDDCDLNLWGEKRSALGKKLRAVSANLVLGLAGQGSELDEVVGTLEPDLAAEEWPTLETATRAVVKNINDRTDVPQMWISVVVAGTVGSKRDQFACGPLSAMSEPAAALGSSIAWAGTGGLQASLALVEAVGSRPDLTGEERLKTIVLDALGRDPQNTSMPIWRIDLGNDTIEPAYKWLE